MILKYQIAFKLRPNGKGKNLFQIQQHATFNGQRLISSTGCQLNDLDAWDAENQCVKDGYKGPKGETTDDIIGLKNSSIEKKLRFLRWFLNWTTENGYNTNMTYKSFKSTLKTQKR